MNKTGPKGIHKKAVVDKSSPLPVKPSKNNSGVNVPETFKSKVNNNKLRETSTENATGISNGIGRQPKTVAARGGKRKPAQKNDLSTEKETDSSNNIHENNVIENTNTITEKENNDDIAMENNDVIATENNIIATENNNDISMENNDVIETENNNVIATEKNDGIAMENNDAIATENNDGIATENNDGVAIENNNEIALEKNDVIATENREVNKKAHSGVMKKTNKTTTNKAVKDVKGKANNDAIKYANKSAIKNANDDGIKKANKKPIEKAHNVIPTRSESGASTTDSFGSEQLNVDESMYSRTSSQNSRLSVNSRSSSESTKSLLETILATRHHVSGSSLNEDGHKNNKSNGITLVTSQEGDEMDNRLKITILVTPGDSAGKTTTAEHDRKHSPDKEVKDGENLRPIVRRGKQRLVSAN